MTLENSRAVPGILPSGYRQALARAALGRSISIAYSGGVDSRFLAFSAKVLGYEVLLLHAVGPQMAPAETAGAHDYADAMGLEMVRVEVEGISLRELADAGKMRCYACKRKVFSSLLEHSPGRKLCDGTNASDSHGWRPGVAALRELGIFSPLAEAGISKPTIRTLARRLGMPDPQQAARPCLLTRFPYGAEPTGTDLLLVAQAEEFVAAHPDGAGLRFRLRIPQPGRPLLHVEQASIPEGNRNLLGRIEAGLRERFAPQLDGLSVEAVEKLSGYYDRGEDVVHRAAGCGETVLNRQVKVQ